MKKICAILICCAGMAFASPNYHYSLQNTEGKTITQADFPNQYQLIAFGYTHCPDVCPTTLYDFKQVLKNLPHPERIQPIFITIDPTRDAPKQLAEYVAYFDKRIIPLHGDRKATDIAVNNFNASYGYQIDGKKVDVDNLPANTAYNVYHSTLIYFLNPKGELIDVFDYQSGENNLKNSIEDAIAHDHS